METNACSKCCASHPLSRCSAWTERTTEPGEKRFGVRCACAPRDFLLFGASNPLVHFFSLGGGIPMDLFEF